MKIMKTLIICFFIFNTFLLGICCDTSNNNIDEKIIIEKKANQKYNLSAIFYGANIKYGNNRELSVKVIEYVTIKDNKTGAEIRYLPNDSSTEQAADFYFTDVWSPDEEYLVLPIGKFKGFGVFKAKDVLENIKSNNYFDKIKVKSENSGFFWHNFEKWEDASTFSFRAGLDGDMFAFGYNLKSSELYCYQESCENFDIGFNNKSEIKAIKKGILEPTIVH